MQFTREFALRSPSIQHKWTSATLPVLSAQLPALQRVAQSTVEPRPAKFSVRPHAATLSRGEEQLHVDIAKKLFTEAEVQEACTRLGQQIAADYQGKDILVLGVLKGSFMFVADLVRAIQPAPRKFEVDFIKASSYGNSTQTSGTVSLDEDFDLVNVRGKHVLVVEDIVDSGLTLSRIVGLLKSSGGAASVKVVALLDKRARRKVQFEPDYTGFDCPDEFVVGYGIDYAERYRNLPYVGVPKPEAI